MDIKKILGSELKEGVGILKKWSWAMTAHTKSPLFEKDFKYKRFWRK